MSKTIVCYIQAFDCEKTIAAAMQSVLDQTYDNWLCFVLSNGNENTAIAPNYSFEIIKSIAAKDKRFVVLNKKINDVWIYIPMLYHLAHEYPDSYICSLDADDVYEKDFFERAISLGEAQDLDIVACGTQIILKERAGEKDKSLISRREVKEDWIVRGSEFTSAFPRYKPFFNELWGKLYHARLFDNKCDWNYADKRFFFRFLPDTLFTIDTLSRTESIGILSGTSHRFYQFEQRTSTNATLEVNAKVRLRGINKLHRLSVYATYETLMAFLQSRGPVDDHIYEYMQAVLFGWFGDYCNRTLLNVANENLFIYRTSQMVMHPKFDDLMTYQGSGAYNNLKDYEERKWFCIRLRHMLVGHKAIRNEMFWGTRARNLRKIEKLIQKLDNTIEKLLVLQTRRE